MGSSIKTRLIKIGNSRRSGIPKPFIEQLDLSENVAIEARDGELVVQPMAHPRSG